MKIDHQISRRSFLVLCGGPALIPNLAWPAGAEVPPLLDHFILGCDDLDRGIDFVEKHTGVRAALGGVHPGRGTRNALLSLGERKYLEIMAVDPAQKVTPQIPRLRELKQPRMVGWAVHPADMKQLAARLQESGIAFKDPQPGSRQRPDGKLLHWRSLTLIDDHDGLLPFFIEWSSDSPPPLRRRSKRLPPGPFCRRNPPPSRPVKTIRYPTNRFTHLKRRKTRIASQHIRASRPTKRHLLNFMGVRRSCRLYEAS
jgi:Glyoxalase-like domain